MAATRKSSAMGPERQRHCRSHGESGLRSGRMQQPAQCAGRRASVAVWRWRLILMVPLAMPCSMAACGQHQSISPLAPTGRFARSVGCWICCASNCRPRFVPAWWWSSGRGSAAIIEQGHEVAYHGYRHESFWAITPDEQRAVMARLPPSFSNILVSAPVVFSFRRLARRNAADSAGSRSDLLQQHAR